ncbi:MAG: pectate lyase [Nibricoccus sp.]
MLLSNSFFKQLLPAALFVCLFSAASHAAVPPQPWPKDPFLPLTDARIASLPEAEQVAWRKYLEVSRRVRDTLPAVTEPEFSPTQPLKEPLRGAARAKGLKANGDATWFGSAEAQAQADRVVEWQSGAGGWSKSNDYSISPRENKTKSDAWSAGTFDNNATILEMRFLARAIAATHDEKRADTWKASFLRGLQYIFNAQYPNGGFPQIYPLAGGYHDAITYNDNAMMRVLELLQEIAAGGPDYIFVPPEQRAEAARRLALGIECVLKTQIVETSGRRTVWCQQHDMLTLQPCAARNFEPIAACTGESVSLVKFLMRLPKPSPETTKAVDAAMAWFEKVAIHNRVLDRKSPQRHLVPEEGAKPLWARMYEIETDRPIFGDRDRTIHYELGEISAERQRGYAWYGEWPDTVLNDYKKWHAKSGEPSRP